MYTFVLRTRQVNLFITNFKIFQSFCRDILYKQTSQFHKIYDAFCTCF
jgi:hypothetical protein